MVLNISQSINGVAIISTILDKDIEDVENNVSVRQLGFMPCEKCLLNNEHAKGAWLIYDKE